MSATYFTSDHHTGKRGTKANDFTPEHYRLMAAFSGVVLRERAAWYVVGDGLEGISCPTPDLIISNEKFLQTIYPALTGFADGNHDPTNLDSGWRRALKMAPVFDIVVDGQRVHVEHGCRYDKENWRNPLWKVAGRGGYWIENHVWPGCDEWVHAKWREWQKAQRERRNGPTGSMPPYWWAAAQLKAEVCPNADVIVLGHSHVPALLQMDDVLYANAGAWAVKQKPDVLVCENGAWRLTNVIDLLAEKGALPNLRWPAPEKLV